MSDSEEVTEERLRSMIGLREHTHLYWCPVGGHWGVTYRPQRICWMRCNYPPVPWTIAHAPEDAQ